MSRQITILAVGRIKSGAFADLIDDYAGKIASDIRNVEMDGPDKRAENMALRAEIVKNPNLFWIALDPKGESLSSEQFAALMEPHSRLGFVIGGADGLDDQTKGLCKRSLSFGPMIWPHKLARAMLIEQIFRAHHIWANHPYHRA